MFKLIKQVFIELLIVSINRPNLIDLNPVKLKYYPY